MSVEYIGEKIFLEEVEAAGQVWVARSVYKNIYAQEEREGVSLPVWSTRERVEDFLKNARLIGPPYEPDVVPLDVFTDAWLSNQMMGIYELQINPDGKTRRILCLTSEEFKTSRDKMH